MPLSLQLSRLLRAEGGHGQSVKFQNSNLHWLFLVCQVIAFGKHTTKSTHTKFEIKIFTYGKAAAN
jgi:hypothetical protein